MMRVQNVWYFDETVQGIPWQGGHVTKNMAAAAAATDATAATAMVGAVLVVRLLDHDDKGCIRVTSDSGDYMIHCKVVMTTATP